MTAPAHRYVASCLVPWALACVDGGVPLRLPEPEAPFQSRILAIECQDEVVVAAFGTEDPPPLTQASCESEARYFVAHFAESLVELGIDPGLVNFGDCPAEAGPRCAEDRLPLPRAGAFFSATRTRTGVLSAWDDEDGGWPTNLRERRFARRNRCRDYVVETVRVDGYNRFTGVFLGPERLVLMGDPHPVGSEGPYSIHLFDLNLEELRTSGLPPTATAIFTNVRGSEIEGDPETGELTIGTSTSPAYLLQGRLSEGLRPIPHPNPTRNLARIARSPDSGATGRVAVRDSNYPGEIYFLEDGQWTPFDGTASLRGECTPLRSNGQRGSMLWLGPHELIVMPNAQEWNKVFSRTATNSPDGYWHFVDDVATWRKVDARDPNDCVGLIANLGELGLVAMTRDPRFFRQVDGEWERFEVLRLPQQPFDDVIERAVPIEHGFAYTREGRRFGYVVDRVSCQEVALDNTALESILTNGKTLVVFGDAPRSGGEPSVPVGPASIHLIDFEDPPP